MIDLNKVQGRKTTMPPRASTRTRRDLGPNHWLNASWEFSLKNSYDNAEAYELDFSGTFEETVVAKGKNKGEKTTKLTGEAADAVTLIRDAADHLGIGVSIRTKPAKARGKVTVTYQGQKRKIYKSKDTDAQNAQQ